MATHFSNLVWRFPWTEELEKLQSMGSQRVRHNLVINTFTQAHEGEREERPGRGMDMSKATVARENDVDAAEGQCRGSRREDTTSVLCNAVGCLFIGIYF